MPFAGMVAWFAVASVVGQPISDMNFSWTPLSLALEYLAPAAVFGFLLILYRVSAGVTQPQRLTDAAMAACVLLAVALAVNLRWTDFPRVFSNLGPAAGAWLMNTVLEPIAWLAFLVTFVRWPSPAISRPSRRAAAWLAVAIFLGALWPAYHFAGDMAIFWWDFPPRGRQAYFMWNGAVQGSVAALQWLLLVAFALAVWRIRPASD